jgi:hypothetical protein
MALYSNYDQRINYIFVRIKPCTLTRRKEAPDDKIKLLETSKVEKTKVKLETELPLLKS